MKLLHTGLIVSTSIFCVLSALSIFGSFQDTQLSKLDYRSDSPDMLRRSAEIFKVDYAIESSTTVSPDYELSMSWLELKTKLDEYSKRLELMQKQRESQTRIFSSIYKGSAISICLFLFVLRITKGTHKSN